METLNGWKVIAAYLRRDERTARRWAAERGLPVRRVPGPGRGSSYALKDEIDAWLAADRAQPPALAPPPVAVAPAELPVVLSPSRSNWRLRWRLGGWVAPGLIAGGLLLAAGGALLLQRPAQSRIVPEPTYADPTTKAMFLQATYDWNLRTEQSLKSAVQEYSGVIGRDPRVADSYVGLANSYLLLREYGSMPDADAYARADAAARAAVALSPQSSEAHRALAFIAFWWRHDRVAARREFTRAIALKPNDPLTHHWYATALLANGQVQAALREIEIARDLDPASTAVLADRGLILYVAGQPREGLEALHRLAHEEPQAVGPHRSLAEIALFEGRADEFLHEAAIVARLRGDADGLAEVKRWAAAGSGTAAVQAAMLGNAQSRHGNWFGVARIAALMGRADEAKGALARACGAHEPATISAPSDLWLSRTLSPGDIAGRCGRVASLS